MKKKVAKQAIALSIALMVGAGSLSGCSSNVDGNKTVATLGDEQILLGVASLMLRYQQAQIETYYGAYMGDNMWSTDLTGEGSTYGETTKSSIMDTLEEDYLLKEHASEYDVEVTEEQKSAIAEAAQSFIDANDATVLEKMGVKSEHVEQLLELYTYQTPMKEAMTADVDTEVSDEEAAQTRITYVQISTAGTTDDDGNTVELTDEEKEAKKQQAQQIIEDINATGDIANADMSTIAKAVDENLTSSSKTYGSDEETLDSAVIEAASTVSDGELVQDVVEGESAYYVVRMDKVFDEEATATEKESIVTQRKNDAYDAQIEEWKDAEEFSIKNSVWKKVKLTDNLSYTLKTTGTEE